MFFSLIKQEWHLLPSFSNLSGMPTGGRGLAEDPSGPFTCPQSTGRHETLAEVCLTLPQVWAAHSLSQDLSEAPGLRSVHKHPASSPSYSPSCDVPVLQAHLHLSQQTSWSLWVSVLWVGYILQSARDTHISTLFFIVRFGSWIY